MYGAFEIKIFFGSYQQVLGGKKSKKKFRLLQSSIYVLQTLLRKTLNNKMNEINIATLNTRDCNRKNYKRYVKILNNVIHNFLFSHSRIFQEKRTSKKLK